ncbi:MAG: hypothetical protein WAT81_03520 [Candidatus Moraniibacteriota bacterium]
MSHYLKAFAPVVLLALGILYLGGMTAIDSGTYSATSIGIAITKTALGAMGSLALILAILVQKENCQPIQAAPSH